MATALKKTRVVFQLADIGTWFENIAVRPSGTLLATRLDVAELWEIDPATGSGSALVTFPEPLKSLTGITEVSPDVFAVGAGQYNLGAGTVAASFGVYLVDLNSASPVPKLVTQIPEAGLINGMTTWGADILLVGDSEFGALYKVDVAAGTYTKLLADETMGSPEEAPLQIGINGIKRLGNHLYFTNSMRQTIFRVPLDANAAATGPVETVVSGLPLDDLAFDEAGTAYVTTHVGNSIVTVTPGAKEGVVSAGSADSLELAGCTAAAFGRRPGDKKALYVVTCGALTMPVKGEETEPAKIVAVDFA